jgi:uncharacterized membrane protein YwzB
MKEINWKSLSLSLIISTILHGTILTFFLIQYLNTMSSIFDTILTQMNNSNSSGKIAFTIAEGQPLISLWSGILFFSVSYILITIVSYFLIELQNQRKKIE